jgi:DNA-binding MarR family transcriptional regulator
MTLTHSELFLLLEIARQNGEAYRTTLSQMLGRDRSTLFRSLESLEARDLIESTHCPAPGKGHDIRVFNITDVGIEEVRKLLQIIRRLSEEAGIE